MLHWMYSADGIGRGGHRLLALTLLVVGGLGTAILYNALAPINGWLLWTGFAAMDAALVLLFLALWTVHRHRVSEAKPTARKVPTPPLESREAPYPPSAAARNVGDDTLIDYDDVDHQMPFHNATANPEFVGTVPRATVVDERPPPPPIPEKVQTRHDFTAKYTQQTPQVREILETAAPQRPKRVMADLADPSVHPSNLPPRTMRGKCGDCDSLLLAPTARPIELECPSCSRVTLLE